MTALAHEDCDVLRKATRDARTIWFKINHDRQYQLEMLYDTLKEGGIVDASIDPIMCALATLTDEQAKQRKKYEAFVQAHAAALDALSGRPARTNS